MSEKSILFNTAMVRAILDGGKTVTRRVIKPQPEPELEFFGWCREGEERGKVGFGVDQMVKMFVKPRYAVGDVLWVRETWRENKYGTGWSWDYKASPEYWYMPDDYPWRPSIHMPRKAARIFLEVTNVRVERVQAITEGGAKDEGIESYWAEPHKDDPPFIGATKELGEALCSTRCEAFKQVWDAIEAKRGHGWKANPWVFVYKFRRVKK